MEGTSEAIIPVSETTICVAFEQVLEMRAADLLLTFDEQLQVDRKCSASGQQAAHGLQVVKHLTFVVDRTPGPTFTVDDDRIERRMGPLIDRVDRLDVVVTVDQYGRGSGGSTGPFRIHRRMSGRREQLTSFESCVERSLKEPFRQVGS